MICPPLLMVSPQLECATPLNFPPHVVHVLRSSARTASANAARAVQLHTPSSKSQSRSCHVGHSS